MGEMTIRDIDDALMVELTEMAETRGVDVNVLASDLLRSAIHARRGGRAAAARAILAAQPMIAAHNSVDLIREDRDR